MTDTNNQPNLPSIQIEEEKSTRYNPAAFEVAWQDRWEAAGLYTFKDDPARPAHYALTMFPYPSGNLHMGHWYAYVAPDARARWAFRLEVQACNDRLCLAPATLEVSARPR